MVEGWDFFEDGDGAHAREQSIQLCAQSEQLAHRLNVKRG